jgi:hypothetical protein
MKHDELRSIAHNVADSLASGIGLLVGLYEMDVFGEAGRSQEGFIIVDFLTGTVSGGQPSQSLEEAVVRYRDALPKLCQKHATSIDAFRELTVRYSAGRSAEDISGRRFVVTIEDQTGHRTSTEYGGLPGQRVKILDHLGRLRPKRR